MARKEKYILMHREDEVLSFQVAVGEAQAISIVEKLAHFDKAPIGMNEDASADACNGALARYFHSHFLATQRWDYREIMDNTGSEDFLDLFFKGHGLSLSDHYWFKREGENLRYADINFFTNKWDDSFARAVLRGDYKALRNVSLNVPDIATMGWGVKGWLCEEDGPKLYKLGLAKDHFEEPLAEVLTSKLAKRMFKSEESLEYELKEIDGKYASVSKALIGFNEELAPLSTVIPWQLYDLYQNKTHDRNLRKEFFRQLPDCSVPGLYEFFVKIACLRSLCFVSDLHFGNLSVIKNMENGQIRVAPLFDFGGAFGSGATGRSLLSNINKAIYLLVYFAYGDLDPDWDYSWYNPESLIGFEDEIREILSKSEFYSPELIANIIDVYQHQKAFLDQFACKN